MATLVLMPKLSPTMEEGVLAKWTRKEGDKIAPGDIIAEVETDKANMDFPLEEEGVLLKLLVKEGDTVKLGAPVAIIGEAGEDPTSAMPSDAKPEAKPAAKVEAKPVEKPAPVVTKRNGRILASPFARKVAREKGIDLATVSGSGPHGRIVSKDLAKARPAQKMIVTVEDQVIPASMMRKTIAKRLVEAKQQIPHIYLTAEATVDRLLDVRAQLNELHPDSKVSVNDLIVKAMALALRAVPDANASWNGDSIIKHGRVDVGIAVSIPDGLITPVVRNADQISIADLSAAIKELAGRARNKKLKPEEFSGGTATVSNLGMFGVREFKAIINPPESVILAVGTTEKKPIVVDDKIVIAQRMTLTLSADHRTVDGVLGAQLLAKIVEYVEKPLSLVIWWRKLPVIGRAAENVAQPPTQRHPAWIKAKLPSGENYMDVRDLVHRLELHTVCESASCPNIGECWNNRALTIMILGGTCTRSCQFCDVPTGKPDPVDADEPRRVALALQALGLRHTVITSVDRDDLPDGGAAHWAETIRAVRGACGDMTLEVLTGDFQGSTDCVDVVLAAEPHIFSHNLETVPRLSRQVRVQARYDRSFAVLSHAKKRGALVKTGIMLGLGEELDEVREVLGQLRDLGCDIITLGQYLRPSLKHLPVARFVHPDEFAALKDWALGIGIRHVEAGPLVRSSYHADQQARLLR